MNPKEIIAWHYHMQQPVRMRWADGVVTELEATSRPADPNTWIAPTLLDVQINGYAGIDFQQDDLSQDALLAAADGLRRDGCSRWLLTLITDDWDRLTQRLKHLAAVRDGCPELERAIAGWHIEGPFLSDQPGFSGAHNPDVMCDPEPTHMRRLREIIPSDPLLVTLAPERIGTKETIAEARSLGITVSMGHTNATTLQLHEAVSAGATGFTHLGNGCPRELDRNDNILWRVFDTPGLTVGFIVDQIHVSPQLFRLAHRVLKPARIYYTSDAMSAAGAPPGRYSLGGLELDVGEDEIVRKPGSQLFAGSALRPIDGIRRAALMLNRPWQELWPHFSEVPAGLVGVATGLKPGMAVRDVYVVKTDGSNRVTACGPVE